MSVVEGKGSASRSSVERSIFNVAQTSANLNDRVSTSFSKCLSNAESCRSRSSFRVLGSGEMVKPALTGPKGDETRSLPLVIPKAVLTNLKCELLVVFLFIIARLRLLR